MMRDDPPGCMSTKSVMSYTPSYKDKKRARNRVRECRTQDSPVSCGLRCTCMSEGTRESVCARGYECMRACVQLCRLVMWDYAYVVFAMSSAHAQSNLFEEASYWKCAKKA
jgi:hypothetical protein